MRVAQRTSGRRRARLLRRALVLLALLMVVELAVGWVEVDLATHPTVVADTWPVAGYPDLAPQRVAFISRTGTRIVGRFFPAPSWHPLSAPAPSGHPLSAPAPSGHPLSAPAPAIRRRATIVLTGGYGGNQNQMLPWADFLHRAGYNVFTYDLRGQGDSGGGAVTFGTLEQYDLSSAVDYLAARPDVDRTRIGALGISLGGSITILTAARDRRIKAVVDDSGFSDLRSMMDGNTQHFVGLPAWLVAPLIVPLARWRTGLDIDAVRPVTVIGRISPRPILIIHGLADTTVSPANSLRNYAAAGRPKSLWLVPGAGHTDSLVIGGVAYVDRVVAFFHRYVEP